MVATRSMLAQMTTRGQHMEWGDSGRSWGMVIVMIVLAVVLVGAVVWAVVYASKASSRNAPAAAPGAGPVASSPTPREVLDLRYAQGEIDTADYEERRAKLD
jgi:putative membrane protein